MELENERKTVVRFGLKLVTSGLTTGTGGNLSVVDRNRGTVAISPSGIEYAVLQPRDVVITDMQETKTYFEVDGTARKIEFTLTLRRVDQDDEGESGYSNEMGDLEMSEAVSLS